MKIALLDKDETYRTALQTRLLKEADVESIVQAASFEESVELGAFNKVDVVVMDLESLGRQRWTILSLLASSLRCPILVLSRQDDFRIYLQSFCCGGSGYILKENGVDCIVAGIRAIRHGLICGSRDLSKQVQAQGVVFCTKPDMILGDRDHPTARQLDILKLASTGLSNAEIAARLAISVGTVKRHLSELYSKLRVRSRTQAIRECERRSWLLSQHSSTSADDAMSQGVSRVISRGRTEHRSVQ